MPTLGMRVARFLASRLWLIAGLLICTLLVCSLVVYYLILPGEIEFLGFSLRRFLVLITLGAGAGGLGALTTWAWRYPQRVEKRQKGLSAQILLWLSSLATVIPAICFLVLGLPEARLGSLVYLLLRLEPILWAITVISVFALLHLLALLAFRDARILGIALLTLMLLAVAAVRLDLAFELGDPRIVGDTESYLLLDLRAGDAFSQLFLSLRPFTVPLVFLLLGKAPVPIAWAQLLVSISSWSFLSITLYKIIRNRNLALVGIAFLLMLSLGQRVTIWDWVLLSESLTLSLLVLVIACGLWFLEAPRVATAIPFILTFTLLIHARADLVFEAAAVSLGLMAAAILWKKSRVLFWSGIALGTVALLSVYFSIASNRSYLTTYHTLEIRTFEQTGSLEYFRDRGMPVNEDGQPEFEDPEFREWVSRGGTSTLASYIISRLPYSIVEPFINEEFPILDDFTTIKAARFRSVLPPLNQDLVSKFAWTSGWLVVAITLISLLVRVHPQEPRAWVGMAVTVLAYPMAVLTWHADGYEPQRHWIGVSAQIAIGVLLCALFLLDHYNAETKHGS